MKIKVEAEKIVKVVKKLDNIEIVLENQEDAKEAIQLILVRTGLIQKYQDAGLTDVNVTVHQKYDTTAVNYRLIIMLEFLFEADVPLDTRVTLIKELQEFFENA